MSRILYRLFLTYLFIAVLRAVEKRFGIVGILVLATFVLVPIFCLRFLPAL